MSSYEKILVTLADGKYHSGQELGELLGISRAAVWKGIQKLSNDYGIEIFSVKGKGYRFAKPVELLDAKLIRASLPATIANQVTQIDVFKSIDSTNQYLMEKSLGKSASGTVVLAETQTAGRGRRGKKWVSPFGRNLYLSVMWRFTQGPAQLACLSLVIAVAIVRVLHQMGIVEAGVKWPNDIYWRDKKLAGILLEMRGESDGPSVVVAGVGINVAMPLDEGQAIEQPWTDLESVLQASVKRNELAANLISEIVSVFNHLKDDSQPLLDEWKQMDILKDNMVEVVLPDKVIHGRANGITEMGALRVLVDGKEMIYHSGEVSIRRDKESKI